jgi:hypothetical protein
MSAPTYHLRMKDLVAKQRTCRRSLVSLNFQLKKRSDAYKAYRAQMKAIIQEFKKERIALRQKHIDERIRAKAEKELLVKSKLEPNFWTYYPNQDGRRDTMTAVLKCLDMPAMAMEQMNELMCTYAEWLLTANKTHENGRPMNRWALMTAFVETRLMAPVRQVERMLKPESVIVQMLIERGDLTVGHTVSRM